MGSKPSQAWLYWTPRILSLAFMIVLAFTSLDVFDSNLDFWQALGTFLLQNIILLPFCILLFFAWKIELVGTITFLLAGLIYIGITITLAPPSEENLITRSALVAGPAFIIALLWWMSWKRRKKTR